MHVGDLSPGEGDIHLLSTTCIRSIGAVFATSHTNVLFRKLMSAQTCLASNPIQNKLQS